MDMVLDGLLRKIQMASNFFVGESVANQADQLLLPPAQSEFRSLRGFERKANIPGGTLEQGQ